VSESGVVLVQNYRLDHVFISPESVDPSITMRILPFLPLGLAAQLPFDTSSISQPEMPTPEIDFTLKESADALSPQDMLTLPRPGAPLPNDIGDLALVPVSTYSFQDRKYALCSFLSS
jgi:hypothetical protein